MGTAAKSWSVTLSPMPGEGERIVHTGEDAVALCRLFFSPSRLLLLLDDVALWAVLEGEDGVATFQCVLELYRWVAILSARWGQRSAFAWGTGASPEAAIGKLEEELRQRNDGGLLALFQQVVGDAGRD